MLSYRRNGSLDRRCLPIAVANANVSKTIARILTILPLCYVFLLAFEPRIVIANEPNRLTSDGKQKASPVFFSDGNEILYTEFSDANLFQLRRLLVMEKRTEAFHVNPSAAEFEPTWSADGEVYAFLKLRGVLSISLVVRDKKGITLAELLPGEGFCGFRSPALAPDHSRILFSYAEGGSQQIYSSRLNGEDRKALTESQGINNWPSYSWNDKYIVFGSSRDGNFEIYRMNADGTHVVRLTENSVQDLRPRFSPDGSKVAFTSHRDGNPEIYVMNVDGTSQIRITNSSERDDFVEWFPDGKRLLFVSERAGRHDLYWVGLNPE